MQQIYVIILIVAGIFTLLTTGIILFVLGYFANRKPGNSIPYHDLHTGKMIYIYPKSIRPSGTLGKVFVKQVGAFMIFNKEICVDDPYLEKHTQFGKPLFAVSPVDVYTKHVLGNVMVTYDQYQQARLDAADYKLRWEQLETMTETRIHDDTKKRVKLHFEYIPFMGRPKKSQQGGSGGGGNYGQQQY